MNRNSYIIVLGAALEAAVCDAQPRWQECYDSATCDLAACEFDKASRCQRQQVDPKRNPLDKKCDHYQLIESERLCKDDSVVETGQTEKTCRDLCTAEAECQSWSLSKDGECLVCSTTEMKRSLNVYLTGVSDCVNCHEAVSSTQCTDIGCVMTEGKCERDCQPQAPAADGTCSYFCPQEGKKCKVDGLVKNHAATADVCKNLCNADPKCNVFEFDMDGKTCQFCATEELIDTAVGYEKYWISGERMCETTTTTSATAQLPTASVTTASVTTMAPSESMTADVGASSAIAKVLLRSRMTKSDITGTTVAPVVTTLAPSESMTADASASTAIVKDLLRTKLLGKSEMTSVRGEGRLGSAIFFGGGVLAGVIATLVAFVAAKRQFGAAGTGVLYSGE